MKATNSCVYASVKPWSDKERLPTLAKWNPCPHPDADPSASLSPGLALALT